MSGAGASSSSLQQRCRLERTDLPGADRLARRPDDWGGDMIEKMVADARNIGERRRCHAGAIRRRGRGLRPSAIAGSESRRRQG